MPLVYVNPGFERMTGYRADEVLGRNCRFLQGRETDADAIAEVRAAIAERRETAVEVLNYKKNGAAFWNALFISPGEGGYHVERVLTLARAEIPPHPPTIQNLREFLDQVNPEDFV